MKKILYFFLALSLLLPYQVWGANATEAFNYTATESLVGQGAADAEWGEAWTDGDCAADFTVQTGGQAGNTSSSVMDACDDRNLVAAVTNGHGSFYVKMVNAVNTFQVIFQSTGEVERILFNFVRVGVDSSVRVQNTTIGTWSAIAFKQLQYEFGTDNTLSSETPCTANQVRANWDGGTWSACLAFSNNGTVDQLNVVDGGSISGDGNLFDTFSLVDADAGGGAVIEAPSPIFIDF